MQLVWGRRKNRRTISRVVLGVSSPEVSTVAGVYGILLLARQKKFLTFDVIFNYNMFL
tara:strand:+ start:295 stop:468 length:174 start_codon:yes stop_codon:yes gene_type:complete